VLAVLEEHLAVLVVADVLTKLLDLDPVLFGLRDPLTRGRTVGVSVRDILRVLGLSRVRHFFPFFSFRVGRIRGLLWSHQSVARVLFLSLWLFSAFPKVGAVGQGVQGRGEVRDGKFGCLPEIESLILGELEGSLPNFFRHLCQRAVG
jgi:hypothetical protein